ncbi:MAG: zinc-binding alcohol dehydrogenase family protein [Actinobacteria bacterium]|nr:zinc-binding alcohol dehydrogenase family protein [Actinomycetota bacterium]
MKAAVYYETGLPEVFRYEDVPDPACFPGGVLIEVEAISIEGGDTLNRAGGMMTSTPHIVGYQCAGTIREVGDGVSDRHVGQRVVATMLSGSHAELVAVPSLVTWPVADGADLVAAACVPVAFGTADDCLFEFGRLQPAETVLIQAGAGGVGVAAIQLAKRTGATVVATASSLDRLEPLLDLGLDHPIDYSQSGWVGAVRSVTGGRGVDLVVDSVGGSVLQGSVQCLAYRGRCITVGHAGRDPQPFDISVLAPGNHSLTGVFLGAEIATDRARQMIQRHVDDVGSGTLTVLVDRTFPLADAAAAHAFIESRQAVGRVVLIP